MTKGVRSSLRRFLRFQFLVLGMAFMALVGGSGCTTYSHKSAPASSQWTSGRVAEAAASFTAEAERRQGGKDGVVWDLEAGAAERATGRYPESNRHLHRAASAIDQYEAEAKFKVSSETLALMSNQQNLPYRGQTCDKIMLHTYTGLNYLALGQPERARPEIIRAYQRQQDAVAENQKRIEQAKSQQAATNSSPKEKATARSVAQARQDPRLNTQLGAITRELEGFRFYADYVNPFTVYLDGLYFLHQGSGGSDLERAVKSLRRVAEVTRDNKHVQADLKTLEEALQGKRPAGLTYVIFETGRAPSREQVRIDIPILFVNVSYVGAAFPKLVMHPDFVPGLEVRAGPQVERTALVADMDAVVALEFKNDWPGILTRTLVSTTAKAAATYFINDAGNQVDPAVGLLFQIGTAIGGLAMNVADTRCWTTLPKQFQVARVTTPADRKLTLNAPGFPPVEVALEPASVNVVYVKSIATGSALLVSQFKLK
jgi:uncharacterized protein